MQAIKYESKAQKRGLALAVLRMEVLFAVMRMNGINQRERTESCEKGQPLAVGLGGGVKDPS